MTIKVEDIQAALKSWHGGDDLLNPLVKLAGEAGELLDARGKDLYKPSWSWDTCVCGSPESDFIHSEHSQKALDLSGYKCKGRFRTIKEDEAGDLTYYLRIVHYLLTIPSGEVERPVDEVTRNLIRLNYYAAKLTYELIVLKTVPARSNWIEHILTKVEESLRDTLEAMGLDYEEVLKSNYVKLNSEDSNHGWKAEHEAEE